jgi:catechol 2,3-dioxygenase-like lactoylglutathione lyase family enzyme
VDPDSANSGTPRIVRLELKTHVLDDLRCFYGETIGFNVLAETDWSVAFAAGATRLEFEQTADGTRPYYHVAFNVPERMLDGAVEWLGARVPILRHAETGETRIHFADWNADAVFFHDPAGSLIELIARHTLPDVTDGPFSVGHILYASEIGLVPADQASVFARIRDELEIEPYLGTPTFLGDERGLIIVIPADRHWIPEFTKTGRAYPTRVTVAGHGARMVRIEDGPFELVGVGA